jgi:hypothetical protein
MMAKTGELIEWLQNIRCDREPFTPEHAQCVCRLAHAAAARLETLQDTLETGLSLIEETWDGITDPEEVVDWALSTRIKLTASATADSPEGASTP